MSFIRLGKTVCYLSEDGVVSAPIIRDNAASNDWLDSIAQGLYNQPIVNLLKKEHPVGPNTDYEWINYLVEKLK